MPVSFKDMFLKESLRIWAHLNFLATPNLWSGITFNGLWLCLNWDCCLWKEGNEGIFQINT